MPLGSIWVQCPPQGHQAMRTAGARIELPSFYWQVDQLFYQAPVSLPEVTVCQGTMFPGPPENGGKCNDDISITENLIQCHKERALHAGQLSDSLGPSLLNCRTDCALLS